MYIYIYIISILTGCVKCHSIHIDIHIYMHIYIHIYMDAVTLDTASDDRDDVENAAKLNAQRQVTPVT